MVRVEHIDSPKSSNCSSSGEIIGVHIRTFIVDSKYIFRRSKYKYHLKSGGASRLVLVLSCPHHGVHCDTATVAVQARAKTKILERVLSSALVRLSGLEDTCRFLASY